MYYIDCLFSQKNEYSWKMCAGRVHFRDHCAIGFKVSLIVFSRIPISGNLCGFSVVRENICGNSGAVS